MKNLINHLVKTFKVVSRFVCNNFLLIMSGLAIICVVSRFIFVVSDFINGTGFPDNTFFFELFTSENLSYRKKINIAIVETAASIVMYGDIFLKKFFLGK